jgi:undecaprenyl diphosphate synthase
VPQTITGNTQTEEDRTAQAALQTRGTLPVHVAAIMDGNGRWAQERNRPRVVGHREGVNSVRDITEACAQLGVGYLTLYTFSTENWNRPSTEVNALMTLLIHTIEKERQTLLENDVRLRTIGDISMLPSACQRELKETQERTRKNSRLTLTLALSYSGQWDILQAVREIARAVQAGRLDPDAIDEAVIAQHLATADMPDPDLLVRTGGEFRLSNFLLWQTAYTELYITEKYWPDFRREQLYRAIRAFQDRDRRFGRVSDASS